MAESVSGLQPTNDVDRATVESDADASPRAENGRAAEAGRDTNAAGEGFNADAVPGAGRGAADADPGPAA